LLKVARNEPLAGGSARVRTAHSPSKHQERSRHQQCGAVHAVLYVVALRQFRSEERKNRNGQSLGKGSALPGRKRFTRAGQSGGLRNNCVGAD